MFHSMSDFSFICCGIGTEKYQKVTKTQVGLQSPDDMVCFKQYLINCVYLEIMRIHLRCDLMLKVVVKIFHAIPNLVSFGFIPGWDFKALLQKSMIKTLSIKHL